MEAGGLSYIPCPISVVLKTLNELNFITVASHASLLFVTPKDHTVEAWQSPPPLEVFLLPPQLAEVDCESYSCTWCLTHNFQSSYGSGRSLLVKKIITVLWEQAQQEV
jgi:hypothetical protein